GVPSPQREVVLHEMDLFMRGRSEQGDPNVQRAIERVALARAALERGAEVRLVLGSATVEPPYGAQTTRVSSAEEMLTALRRAIPLRAKRSCSTSNSSLIHLKAQ
ncbi:hypothetical protein LCGC14_1919160, partial [marine sediment metagenome]